MVVRFHQKVSPSKFSQPAWRSSSKPRIGWLRVARKLQRLSVQQPAVAVIVLNGLEQLLDRLLL